MLKTLAQRELTNTWTSVLVDPESSPIRHGQRLDEVNAGRGDDDVVDLTVSDRRASIVQDAVSDPGEPVENSTHRFLGFGLLPQRPLLLRQSSAEQHAPGREFCTTRRPRCAGGIGWRRRRWNGLRVQRSSLRWGGDVRRAKQLA